uniref:Calpain catalytic domain-containing protein n=1 Tax=Thelazia callipaeda TaxID=103827 RepID=A0A0N5CM46_THECL
MSGEKEEKMRKIHVGQDEFAGLIGGLAGNFLQNQVGGSAGQVLSGLLREGGNKIDQGGFNIGDMIGQFTGGNTKGSYGGERNYGGGENIPMNILRGGVFEMLSDMIGKAAHHFLGVDPQTGRIIGAVAGNVLFQMGGKDNSLSNIGKIVLDNIISGKFHRKLTLFGVICLDLIHIKYYFPTLVFIFPVDPYVPRDPHPIPRPASPGRKAQALDFYEERDRCLKTNTLFEDPEFPANDSSLFYSRKPPKYVKWLRPGEIVHEPTLIAEGQSRFDVIQGELGDCWLMAGAASLTLRDELFYRVIPPDQSFTENYAGIFHFQFWHYGNWIDVVIDDRLPTSDGKLLYMHSRELNSFWSALMEKAYAKLYGNYEALRGGTTSEALEDMTGGLTEFISLNESPPNMLQMMFRAFEMGSLFGCSIEASPMEFEMRTNEGLVKGHAYSITGMRMVDTPNGKIPLLRIRNPWGNEQEWNGDWSDESELWGYVSDQQKRDMNLVLAHDGEFWMSFNDFNRYFDKLEICNLGPDVMDDVREMTGVSMGDAGYQRWNTRNHLGAWIGKSAGGCRNYLNSFVNNYQYAMTLSDPNPEDEDGLCTVIIAVLQKNRRELKSRGFDNLAIGFAVYEVNNIFGPLDHNFFMSTKSCARSTAFINLREVSGRFRLQPGHYVIIPSTFEPGEEGEYILRIFTNVTIESKQIG